MKISISNFTGIAPKYGTKSLPDNAAQVAENVRLESGEIRPLNSLAPIIATVRTNAASIFPIGGPSFTYLSWTTDVDVARSPVSDSEERIYYTGDGVPKKTFLALATSGTAPFPNATTGWYHLGVPKPTAVITATATGTGTITETRVYVYTFVTQFGTGLFEESAPSAPTTVTLTNNASVSLSNLADLTPTTNYNFVKKRIYRSVGAGALLLVAEIPAGTTTFSDTLVNIPGDLLISTDWAPPPADLKGICLLPGGVLAGFRNNEIWFSEPEYPHAWPPKYMQTVNAEVVAIRPFGNNLAVATENYPEVGSGLYPDSFTFSLVPLREPAVSKRSMAGDENGVTYASNTGLVTLGNNGNGIATKAVLTRYEFVDYSPSTMLGVSFDGKYLGFYTTDDVPKVLVFNSGDNPPLSTASVSAQAVTVEPVTNKLVVLNSANILAYFDPLDTLPMSFIWRSKVFEVPYPMNFAAAKITGPDVSVEDSAFSMLTAAGNQAIATQNAAAFATGALGSTLNSAVIGLRTVNGSTLRQLTPLPETTFSVNIFAGARNVYTGAVTQGVPFRLPAGFKARTWEIQISGQMPIQRIEMATSMEELTQ